jgi:hypothetical protein
MPSEPGGIAARFKQDATQFGAIVQKASTNLH